MTNQRTKVTHVIPSMTVGGREKVVLDILDHLDRSRFELELVCLGGQGALYDEFLKRDVPIRFFWKRSGVRPGLFLELRRYLAKSSCRIVHSHNPGAFMYAAVAALSCRVPVIINSEHGYGEDISWAKTIVESILTKSIDLTLAVSDELRVKLMDRPFSLARKVKTLHNGVDVEAFGSCSGGGAVRSELGFSGNHILIGTVGRLEEVKDHETLIRAFKIVHDVNPDCRLVIVGEGRKRRELTTLSGALNLNGAVTFTGERRDVSSLLSAMNIFVLPSRSEGISITLLEAMASGTPVVATSVGGNPEIVEPGLSGLLVPPGSVDGLADAVLRLVHQPDVGRALGSAGRKRVRERFSLSSSITELESVYDSLLVKERR